MTRSFSNPAIPDLVRDPAFLPLRSKAAGPRIKPGVTPNFR